MQNSCNNIMLYITGLPRNASTKALSVSVQSILNLDIKQFIPDTHNKHTYSCYTVFITAHQRESSVSALLTNHCWIFSHYWLPVTHNNTKTDTTLMSLLLLLFLTLTPRNFLCWLVSDIRLTVTPGVLPYFLLRWHQTHVIRVNSVTAKVSKWADS